MEALGLAPEKKTNRIVKSVHFSVLLVKPKLLKYNVTITVFWQFCSESAQLQNSKCCWQSVKRYWQLLYQSTTATILCPGWLCLIHLTTPKETIFLECKISGGGTVHSVLPPPPSTVVCFFVALMNCNDVLNYFGLGLVVFKCLSYWLCYIHIL